MSSGDPKDSTDKEATGIDGLSVESPPKPLEPNHVDELAKTARTGELEAYLLGRKTPIAISREDTSTSRTQDAYLVLIYPSGPGMGKRFRLTDSQYTLGRDESCTIQADHDSTSRKHARILRIQSDWSIIDLHSTNGTYVNDTLVNEAPLRDKDLVKIGAVIFKFLQGDGVEASYHELIYKLTIVDALTETHNASYFREFLESEIGRCVRYRRPLSLILFDIDHLRAINDKHGHITGDEVLRELSRRTLGRVRAEQWLARCGGDEFAVVLPETDLAGARTFGEEICRTVADRPFEHAGKSFSVSVSLGVACLQGEATEVQQFINIAKHNLYRAKREGRNRVVAGTEKWQRWKAVPSFRSDLTGKMAIAALSLLGRDQILASASAVAYVDDLEGMLYSHLREHERPEQRLSFGVLEGGGKLLVAVEGRNPADGLRAIVFEALRKCAEERPEARFAVGPIGLVKEGARAIEDAVTGLDAEIGALENGHHLPHPMAVALRAIEGVTPARAKLVLELGETLLQWLALCAAAELEAAGRPAGALPPLRRCLSGGAAGPAIEGWLEVLAAASAELLDAETVHHAAWRASLGDWSTREEVLGWLGSFAELRDTFTQGATARDEHVARKLVDEAAPRLRQLVRRELRPLLALIPAEIELVGFEGELQSYRMTRLIGDGVAAPVPLYSRRRMNSGLWLCDVIADRAVPLEPFFVRDTCPKCGARELFLLSGLSELELRNPASGHVLRKPAEDLPVSADARERLIALTAASSAGEPIALTASASTGEHRAPAAPKLRARKDTIGPDDRPPTRPGGETSPPRPPVQKHTILFLAANPAGTDRLALDREAHAIQVELERSGFRDCFELVTRWAAEPIDLLRELRRLRPTIIHFSGRGHQRAAGDEKLGELTVAGRPTAERTAAARPDVARSSVDAPPERPTESEPHPDEPAHGLYFQGPDGRAQLVSTAALQETFGAAGASVQLVVLSACYSEAQAEALVAHVGCVVSVSGAIRDDAARSFAIGFYGGLGERESILAAYKQGRAAVSLEGLRDADRPQLKVRADVDAARLVLAALPAS